MRRLAVVTMGTAALIGIGPATAGLGSPEHEPSWCDDNADAVARMRGSNQFDLVIGVGAESEKPVQSGYACVDGEVGRRHVDGIVTAWVDTQYGNAGWSCARQPTEAVTCKRRSADLPGNSSDPATSPRNEWRLKVLGVGLAYDLDTASVAAGTRAERSCVSHDESREACTDDQEYRAWAQPSQDQVSAGAQDRGVTATLPGPPDAPGD